MATKRPRSALNGKREDDDPVDPDEELEFVALGGGNEVGRSCHILKYKGKTVMLDAGIHPAYDGLQSLPFYDDYDLSEIDLLLITHFHMDHAASLPFVLAKTNFEGRVYMTHPTKAIYKHLMQDSVRVQNTHTLGNDAYGAQIYSEQDLIDTLPRIQTIGFHTTHTHNGIKFTPYPAGHVLGACMYLIEIAGLNILFTGDYSRENNRHLIPASVPRNVRVDLLITESTFGISTQKPRAEREANLTNAVTRILDRGGRALLPVFALGGAQELLLILEEFWSKNDAYQRYPIYFASNLARKCMVVYQTYIDAMNENIRAKFQSGAGGVGPFDFRFIRALRSLERFDDVGGCVMLASPGMLQSGVSRSLLERWAPNDKNGVVVTGYSVEGTMARTLVQSAPDNIPVVMSNRQNVVLGKRVGGDKAPTVSRKCSIEEITFAAHVDGAENLAFIQEVAASVVILVHGERHAMGRLHSRLLSTGKFTVYSPPNCEYIRIPFRQDKLARVVGSLANTVHPLPSPADSDEVDPTPKKPKQDIDSPQNLVNGVLVQNEFKLQLMSPEDLKEFAGVTTTTILCKQRITLAAAGVELIKWALEGAFGEVGVIKPEEYSTVKSEGTPNIKSENEEDEKLTHLSILGGAVSLVHHSPSGEIEVVWEGNLTNDSIADAVLAVLLTVEISPAAVKQSSQSCGGRNPHANSPTDTRLDRLFMFLEAQFGEGAIVPITRPRGQAVQEGEADGDKGESSDGEGDKEELKRLHSLGIPVPGVEITVEGTSAKVWLEDLEVECPSRIFAERVRAVVARAVKTTAPVWR
ncbi:endoribonuclease YSH1 [Piedraia hortae CBS 480.64]|uniref:Endoribonuclease YSH1 n=1 Tax=Piedraia hortae CBS 480.64 TaxID=1314780 RepID=A0A6A7BYH5_9PEZI|nr:endoribonuclease YSH1 [Piedraia hortae CBS 480.64]